MLAMERPEPVNVARSSNSRAGESVTGVDDAAIATRPGGRSNGFFAGAPGSADHALAVAASAAHQAEASLAAAEYLMTDLTCTTRS